MYSYNHILRDRHAPHEQAITGAYRYTNAFGVRIIFVKNGCNALSIFKVARFAPAIANLCPVHKNRCVCFRERVCRATNATGRGAKHLVGITAVCQVPSSVPACCTKVA